MMSLDLTMPWLWTVATIALYLTLLETANLPGIAYYIISHAAMLALWGLRE